MESILKILEDEGWCLKDSVVEDLQRRLPDKKKQTYGEIRKLALDSDLAEIGSKYIQEKISACKDNILIGPVVLQVSKVRNVSAPKENEYSNVAPRMLRVTLTDGFSSITAIEYEQIEQISLKTAPGTKVRLIGSIMVTNGHLQLEPGSVKILGGRVEKLYTRWRIALDTVGHSRAGITTEGAPPPFVAFGKHVQKYSMTNKSLKKTDNKNDEAEDKEFEEQRKAAIAEVAKGSGGPTKVFSSDIKANFGIRPQSDTGFKRDKKATSFGTQTSKNREEISHDKQSKSTGIYRELSTESGENIHQKTLNEFLEMGFDKEDVVYCMRKCNNDFESTMDMLVSNAEAKESHNQNRGGYRGKRGDNRGLRRGGRGRGRGRSNYNIEDESEYSQTSKSATLFDFVETKISIPKDGKKYTEQYSSKSNNENEVPTNHNGYDQRNRYQDSNRGFNNRGRGGNRGYNDRGRGRGDGNRFDKWRDEKGMTDSNRGRGFNKSETNRDVSRGRGYKNYGNEQENTNKYDYDSNRGRGYNRFENGRGRRQKFGNDSNRERGHNKYDKNPEYYQGNRKPDRYPEEQQQSTNSYHDKNQRGGKFDRNDENPSKKFDEQKADKRDVQNERLDSGKRYSSTRASENSKRNIDAEKEQNGVPSTEYKTHASKNLNYQRSGERNEPDIPPRFKKGNNQAKGADFRSTESMDSKQYKKGGRNTQMSNEAGDFHPNMNIAFSNMSLNPPPAQRGPTTFGEFSPPNANANRPNPSNIPHDIVIKTHFNGPQVQVSLPNFHVGASCLAKYWEDHCYYRAVITDMHQTAPTAVVQFIDFGNYEEVQLFDLKPMNYGGPIHGGTQFPQTQGAVPNPHLNMMNPHRQRQNDRPAKPPMQLYVPPQSRNTS